MSFVVNLWLSSGAGEKWQSRWTIGMKRYGSRIVIEFHKRVTPTLDGGRLLAYSVGTGNPLPKFDPARDFPHTQIVPHFYELFHIMILRATNGLKTYTVRIHTSL